MLCQLDKLQYEPAYLRIGTTPLDPIVEFILALTLQTHDTDSSQTNCNHIMIP